MESGGMATQANKRNKRSRGREEKKLKQNRIKGVTGLGRSSPRLGVFVGKWG